MINFSTGRSRRKPHCSICGLHVKQCRNVGCYYGEVWRRQEIEQRRWEEEQERRGFFANMGKGRRDDKRKKVTC